MQKQQKQDLNYKNKKKEQKILIKLKKIFKNKPLTLRPFFNRLAISENLLNESAKFILNIKITPNNMFFTLKNRIKNVILYTGSSGKKQIKISKKTLKFQHKILIQKFIDEIKHLVLDTTIVIVIAGPIKTRRSIIKFLGRELKINKLIIQTAALKCFNGCRAKKKKRKKRKSLRIFK